MTKLEESKLDENYCHCEKGHKLHKKCLCEIKESQYHPHELVCKNDILGDE